MSHRKPQPNIGKSRRAEADLRDERRAAALRANLRRRKEQARLRAATGDAGGDPPADKAR